MAWSSIISDIEGTVDEKAMDKDREEYKKNPKRVSNAQPSKN